MSNLKTIDDILSEEQLKALQDRSIKIQRLMDKSVKFKPASTRGLPKKACG